MCDYLSFCVEWVEGHGLQAYATGTFRQHAPIGALWNLSPTARRYSWERDGAENLVISHGQEMTPEIEAERQEILRLWPTRHELTLYLLGKLIDCGKLHDLDLAWYEGTEPIEKLAALTHIGGDAYLSGYAHPLAALTHIGGYAYLRGYAHPLNLK